MEKLNFGDSVVDWVAEYPALIPVLEKHGIEYCCGGKSLDYVCRQKGCDPQSLLAQVQQAVPPKPQKPPA